MIIYRDTKTNENYYFHDLDHWLDTVMFSDSKLANGIRDGQYEFVPITPDARGWEIKGQLVGYLVAEKDFIEGREPNPALKEESDVVQMYHEKYRAKLERWDYDYTKYIPKPYYATQKDWNQTLTTVLNRCILRSEIDSSSNKPIKIVAPQNFMWLFKSLMDYNAVTKEFNGHKVRFIPNNRNDIVVGDYCIEVLNYKQPDAKTKADFIGLMDKLDEDFLSTLHDFIDIYGVMTYPADIVEFYNWLKDIENSKHGNVQSNHSG